MTTEAEYYKKQYERYEKKFVKEIEYSESLKTKLALEEIQRKLYELECVRLTEKLDEKLNKSFFKRLFNL